MNPINRRLRKAHADVAVEGDALRIEALHAAEKESWNSRPKLRRHNWRPLPVCRPGSRRSVSLI